MKRFKYIIYYITVVCIVTIAVLLVFNRGLRVENEVELVAFNFGNNSLNDFFSIIKSNLQNPISVLFVQIVIIIFVARVISWIFRKIGQPMVIGEIIAGILLGPSLLGLYFPEISALVFPASSLDNLHFISQIGLVLFMFTVGLELDLSVLKTKAKDAIVIGNASVIFPFIAGILLSVYLFPVFAANGVTFLSFALFFGISMSVTAFPVLARIARERAMHKTKTGTIVMACAAANDLLVWLLLVIVLSIVRTGTLSGSIYTIISGIAYVLFMLKLIRPFLQRIGEVHPAKENMSKPIVAIFFSVLISSSFIAEVIGVHALFGAFLAGAIMPDSLKFRSMFIEKVEDVSIVLLLPLFFVFTGLRTEIGLLDELQLWKTTGIITIVAVFGKVIGVVFTAKIFGQNWKDSLMLASLLNTRGLMVLIILNIGYDYGVFSTEIFTILVIMALITTFLTAPTLNLIDKFFSIGSAKSDSELTKSSKYNILISFANPDTGKSMLRLANSFVKKLNDNATITTMHLVHSSEISQYNYEQYEAESFDPVIKESKFLNQKITTLFKASGDIVSEISEIANKGNYDFLLIGCGKSIFEGNLLGKMLGFTTKIINPDVLINQVTGKDNIFNNYALDLKTQLILSKTDIPVGVLIDKGLENINYIVIPIFSEKDIAVLCFVQKIIKNSGAQVTFIDLSVTMNTSVQLKELIKRIELFAPNHISLIRSHTIASDILAVQDLVMISDSAWKKAFEHKCEWLSCLPSVLIISDKNQA